MRGIEEVRFQYVLEACHPLLTALAEHLEQCLASLRAPNFQMHRILCIQAKRANVNVVLPTRPPGTPETANIKFIVGKVVPPRNLHQHLLN